MKAFKTSDGDMFKEKQQKEIERLTGYRLGKFHNQSGACISEDEIWYSFDEKNKHYNFHIVPDQNATIEVNLSEWMNTFMMLVKCMIKENLIKAGKNDIDASTHEGNSIPHDGKNVNRTLNHKWIEARSHEFEYLLLLGRLWCDTDNVLR